MGDQFELHQLKTPPTTSTPRDDNPVRLIVLHSDPRPADEALAAYTGTGATRAPHYYIDREGTISALVPEEYAAAHSGFATWNGERYDLDLISIGVALEHSSGAPVTLAQHISLSWLVGEIGTRYEDVSASEVLAWVPDITLVGQREGVLTPLYLPSPPLDAKDCLDSDFSFDLTSDPFWNFLQGETYRQRGEKLVPTWAFHQRASANRLGTPLASPAKPPLSYGGRQFGAQVFGADVLFNENPKWAEVQSLNVLLNGQMPTSGFGFELLKMAYAASGSPLFPNWAFHHTAVREHLGTPLGNAGEINVGGQKVNFQIFSGDTLYTLLAEPLANTNWGDVRRLSATPPGPIADALWTESYKLSGAPYDPSSPFHQQAVQDKLGTPLTGVYQGDFNGTAVALQVFGLDTLYQPPGDVIQRLSARDPGMERVPLSAAPPPAAAPAPAPAPVTASADPNWPPRPNFNPLPSTAARQKLFGAFQFVAAPLASNPEHIKITDGWQQQNIVPVTIPQLRGIKGAPANGVILFHRLAAKQLADMFAAWEAAGLSGRILNWAGTFVPRYIRGSRTELSQHAFGTAFDINVPWNGLGARPALVGQQGCVRELVPIAHQYGFYWGGHFSRLDGMHFEVAQIK